MVWANSIWRLWQVIASRYKVEITLETPKVAFRETIRKNSDVDSKYKKQSGGHGQYGHVKMKFEPSGDLETPFVFEECVVGGAVPRIISCSGKRPSGICCKRTTGRLSGCGCEGNAL